jgi:hypothetical protein
LSEQQTPGPWFLKREAGLVEDVGMIKVGESFPFDHLDVTIAVVY